MAKGQSLASCVTTPHFCIQATNTSVHECQAFPWSTLKGMPQSQLLKATVHQYIKFSMDLLATPCKEKECHSASSQDGYWSVYCFMMPHFCIQATNASIHQTSHGPVSQHLARKRMQQFQLSKWLKVSLLLPVLRHPISVSKQQCINTSNFPWIC